MLCGQAAEYCSAASTTTTALGAVLLIASLVAGQASNRGYVAVATIAAISLVCTIWMNVSFPDDGDQGDGNGPAVVLPLIGCACTAINLLVPALSKWTELTSTVMAAGVAFAQLTIVLHDAGDDQRLMDDGQRLSFRNGLGPLDEPAFVYWLAQFLLLPVVFFGRASLSPLFIMLTSGLLREGLACFTIPAAGVLGLLLIKLTPRPDSDSPPTLQAEINDMLLALGGTDTALTRTLSGSDTGPDNRCRGPMCLFLTPLLTAAYLISATNAAANESVPMLRVATATIAAPVILGVSHMVMHGSQRTIAAASIAAAVLLSPGPYLDPILAVVFSVAIVGGVFVAGRQFRASQQRESGDLAADPTASTKEIETLQQLHAACAVPIFALLVANRLSVLHWTQPWVYIIVLYLGSYLPLSATKELRWADGAAANQHLYSGTRLLRPGCLGPFVCVWPALFWTVFDNKWICGLSQRSDGNCNETGMYPLFLLTPLAFILVEYYLDDVVSDRHLSQRIRWIASKQWSRTCAIWLLVAAAVPFRLLLIVSDGTGKDYYESWIFDTNITIGTIGPSCVTNSSLYPELNEWCGLALDEHKTASWIFTFLLFLSPALLFAVSSAGEHGQTGLSTSLMIFSAEAEDASMDLPNPMDGQIQQAANVQLPLAGSTSVGHYAGAGVPPTQGAVAALLFLALLDYFAPICALPFCLVACCASYAGYKQTGNWPSTLLLAVLIWTVKTTLANYGDGEAARWGVQIFGIPPGDELHRFMQSFALWWWPSVGAVLLSWGVFVRTRLVKTWPASGVNSDEAFSFEKLFYIVDALVFYVAVLMMGEISNGWISLVMCVAATGWAMVMRDRTLILRLPVLFLTSFVLLEIWHDKPIGTFSFFATSVACTGLSVLMILVLSASSSSSSPDPGSGSGSGSRQTDGSAETDTSSVSSLTAPNVLVDFMLLCGFLISYADTHVTRGGLALAYSVLALPVLYLRRYPTLLPFTPALVPLSVFYFFSQVN
jgi:hypothetical protein